MSAEEYPSPIIGLRQVERILATARGKGRRALAEGEPLLRASAGNGWERGDVPLLGIGRRVDAAHTREEVEAVRALFRLDLAVDTERPDADPLPSRLAGLVPMYGAWTLVQIRWVNREAELTAHAQRGWLSRRAIRASLRQAMTAVAAAESSVPSRR